MNERELFLAALAIEDPEAREEYLEAASVDHPELCTRVKALLAAHEKESQFLNTPVARQISPPSKKRPAPTTVHAEDSSDAQHAEDGSDPLDDAIKTIIQDELTATDPILPGYLEPSTRPDSLGRLGHYEILELIGKGAFGTVLKGFDEKLHRTVAIKVLAPEMAATSPARKRFLREARTSAAVRHDNVVSIFAVENEPTPYLVMEYIPGETLQERLDGQGPLDLIDVLLIGKQIADGLVAAHEQQLIHRDIKPGNILLKSGVNTHVKITDFGLARTADDASMTQSGTIAGTPLYMAPEQALGQKLDQRADLFSLGSVLYQMVSGRPPFRAPTTVAVLKRVAEETARPIQEIIPEAPGWLCRLIENLHAKDPDDRYDSAAKVSELLTYCLNEVQAGRVPVIDDPEGTQAYSAQVSPAAEVQTKTKQNWFYAGIPILLLVALGFSELTGMTSFSNRRAEIPSVEPAEEVASAAPQAAPVLKAKAPETVMPAAANPPVEGNKGDAPPVSESPEKLESYPLKLAAEPVTHQPGEPLSKYALLQTPPQLPGLLSWTINSRIPRSEVGRALYSPDGKLLATRSDDSTVRIWDVNLRELRHVFSVDSNAGVLTFSPDGKYLATGGTGKTTLGIRDVKTGQMVRSFSEDEVGSSALAWDPRSPRLATCNNNDITVRNLETGVKPIVLEGHHGEVRFLCWSPDGRELASASREDGVIIWDTNSWEEISRIKLSGQLKGLTYAPRGEYLATSRLKNNKTLLEFWQTSNTEPARPAIESEQIYAFVFSPTRPEIMELRGGNVVARRDLTTGEILAEYKAPSMVRSIDMSPDGETLVTGGSDVLAWGLSHGKPEPFFEVSRGKILFLNWSPIGNLISFADYYTLQTLSLADNYRWNRVGGLGGNFGFTSDERYLYAKEAPEKVGFFDPETGIKVKTIQVNGYCRVSLSPDSRLLAAVSTKKNPDGGGFPLELIDVENKKPVWTHISKISELGSTEFSPDGKWIAISGLTHDKEKSGNIEVLNVKTGQLEKEFTRIHEGVGAITWSPDSKAIVARRGWTTQFYPLQPGDPYDNLHFSSVGFNLGGVVHFCRDGKTIVASKYGDVASWDLTSGFKLQNKIERLRSAVRKRNFFIGTSFHLSKENTAWSPDDRILAINVNNQLVAFYEHQQDTVLGALSLIQTSDHLGAIAVDKSGHYRVLGKVQDQVCYTILKEDGGQETLTPADFETRFGWKNEPRKVELLKRLAETAPALKAEAPESKSPVKLEPFPLKLAAEPVTHQAGEPLAKYALLQTPPPLPGLLSWTINSRIPRLQVSRVLYSPDGKLLATRSDDCTVRLWNATSKELLHVFSLEHIAGELSFSPNGKYLTIGGTGRTRLQIRDANTGQKVRSFSKDQVGSPVLAWDPQRQLLATCNGKEVTVRNLDTGVKPTVLKEHQGEVRFLCWSPDGRELASASREDGVIIWDTTSWEEISRIKLSGQLKGLEYAPRGEYLATNSLQNNKSLLEFWNTSHAEPARPAIESEQIYSFVFSPTRSEILELRGGNVIVRRDLTTGEILAEYKPQSHVRSIDVSPDGQTLLTGGDEVLAWGLSNGKSAPFFNAYNGKVHFLDWSPTGNLICFNLDHSEHTLSLAEENKWTRLGQLGERLYFTSDGRYLSTRGANGNVGLFDPETGKRVKRIHINGYCRLSMSPDSRFLAAVTWKQTTGGGGFPLEMIDVDTDKPVWTYTSKITELVSIEFSPDGKSIAISGLSIDEGQRQLGHIAVLHVETGQLEKEFTTIDGGVGAISWSPDGKVIAARRPWVTGFFPLQPGDPFVFLETPDLAYNLGGIVHICRDGKTVVTSKYGEVASYEHTSGFKIQDDIKGCRPVRNRKFHYGGLDHMNTAWSPDESILAISVYGLLVAFYEHRQDSVVGTLSVLNGNDQSGAIAIDKSGHYQILGDVQDDFYYTILKEDGSQETLTPADFETRFGWKNEPGKVELLKRLAETALKPENANVKE
ncbi:protein kinase domain-containing protein [Gimesia sp.]|uniref:protein kinase domain-containing protein n=1 Tax=Gimesia sp. TaxID=2024833 RepID=UPI003A95BA47